MDAAPVDPLPNPTPHLQQPDSEPAPSKRGDPTSWITFLHEILAGTISVAILILACWMLAATFLSAHENDVAKHGRQKDVLLLTLSLFGTVTGYYLGRVPAELQARQASQAAQSALNRLETAQGQVIGATVQAAQSTDRLEEARRRQAALKSEMLPKVQDIKAALGNPQIQTAIASTAATGEAARDAPLNDSYSIDQAKKQLDELIRLLED